MKRAIELEMTQVSTKTVEINFPIYRRHDLYPEEGTSIVYSRLDADLRIVRIHVRDYGKGNICYEIDTEQTHQCRIKAGEHDYFLGEGIYECAPDTFVKIADEAIAFVTSFKTVQ